MEAAGSKILVYKTIHHDNSEDQNLNSEHTKISSEEYNIFPINETNTGSVHQLDKNFACSTFLIDYVCPSCYFSESVYFPACNKQVIK
jgi:hypothetical protein